MRRLFGTKQPEQPQVSLEETTKRMDGRTQHLDEKIRQLDKEIVEIKQKMSRLKPGGAKENLKKRALGLLKRKKMYEGQRDQLMNQQFNMENIQFQTETIKDTISTVQVMKNASKELKTQMKNVDIDDIYDMQEEIEFAMEDCNEIQEALSRTYETPDGLDDDELEAELDELGNDIEDEEEIPSYLQNAPSVPTTTNKQRVNDPQELLI
eukprot:TRINITY_DN5596_c0_g1_i1.p1 TRINITY_DN5596_c0_g1~~TRINITY_DN5596_c0_g1_i1.p1  ORF type:complete len:225 (-),score=75.61 TRINITY_DN5596_c0_g1_i1:28-654(-)